MGVGGGGGTSILPLSEGAGAWSSHEEKAEQHTGEASTPRRRTLTASSVTLANSERASWCPDLPVMECRGTAKDQTSVTVMKQL